MTSVLELQHVSRQFGDADSKVEVLKDINLSVLEGNTVSIIGPSGSGKSTLLSICAGLDSPTQGEVKLCNEVLETLSKTESAKLRNEKVGFIFQNFQLFPNLTALENILIPADIAQLNKKKEALAILKDVGLEDRANHLPSQLSGGEQQRVAIARAFILDPAIIFADEPTGNLDEQTSTQIENMLFKMNREKNTTLVLITHDLELAKKCQTSFRLNQGELIKE